MSNPFKTKEFKKLQSEWTKKLKKSGFEDIEDSKGKLLQYSASHVNHRIAPVKWETKSEYYRLAEHFFHEHKFKSLEQSIWELHYAGDSIRTIVKKLKDKGIHTYRFQVHKIIVELRTLMLEKAKKSHE